jgi:hypothetical protein
LCAIHEKCYKLKGFSTQQTRKIGKEWKKNIWIGKV